MVTGINNVLIGFSHLSSVSSNHTASEKQRKCQETEPVKMQYTPFASDIELPFYTALASLKINYDRLDDSARKVLGLYEIRPSDAPNASSRMQIHGNALTSDK